MILLSSTKIPLNYCGSFMVFFIASNSIKVILLRYPKHFFEKFCYFFPCIWCGFEIPKIVQIPKIVEIPKIVFLYSFSHFENFPHLFYHKVPYGLWSLLFMTICGLLFKHLFFLKSKNLMRPPLNFLKNLSTLNNDKFFQ